MAHRLQGKNAMSPKSRQNISKLVFLILDQMGTNHFIKGVRQNFINILKEKFERFFPECDNAIVTGSTAEGIAPLLVSDLDIMFPKNDYLCIEDVNACDESAEFVITKPDFADAPPGYCKLAFGNSNNADDFEEFCYIDTKSDPLGNKLYISSLLIANSFKQCFDMAQMFVKEGKLALTTPFIQGPAITLSGGFQDISIFGLQLTGAKIDFDYVTAVNFYGKRHLKEWAERKRFHDWPSTDIIKEISNMEGYLVPVGEKDSENATLYWRISYVTSEKKLLACFNSTLDKVYVMLKMLTKTLCSTVISKISSYMVKNVVLWIAESNPKCTEDKLIDIFLQCLNFFKLCMLANHLPYYMIPKRNLLSGRIVGQDKTNLIHLLSDLIDKAEEVIQIFPRLSQYISSFSIQPEMFLCYGMWRNYVETLFLIFQTHIIEHVPVEILLKKTYIVDLLWLNFQDERYFDLSLILLKLLVPNYIEMMMRGQFQEIIENFNEVNKEVLNIYLLDKAEQEQS